MTIGKAWIWGVALVASLGTTAAAADNPPAAPQGASATTPAALNWFTRYGEAQKQAHDEHKLLLIYFRADGPNVSQVLFEGQSLSDPAVIDRLRRFVLLRVPTDATIHTGGREMRLLSHPVFAELQGQPGLAIIDNAHEKQPYYEQVVSVVPFSPGKYYRFEARHLPVLLDLPAGTLTQRTMVFAVRIHPEGPASTVGEMCPTLNTEANSHSNYQAQIGVQGHHHWESRFHRISGQLPGGLRAQEVVAESWPNEGLIDAAVDCVHSWRQSPGHWGAVRSSQPRFGYDIQRGRNGIWYATGIFGNNG